MQRKLIIDGSNLKIQIADKECSKDFNSEKSLINVSRENPKTKNK